jgi:hypothetical protein
MRNMTTIATLLALALAACDGRPLLYSLVPSDQDLQSIALFQQIDAAGKGQLSRAETDAYFKRRFSELDRNHDGFLEEGEAAGALPLFGWKTGADVVFHLDINGDGKLSPDEFGRLALRLFTRDTNQDGILTLAEVKVPPSDDYVAPRENAAANSTVKTIGH